jgi:hypothetical protein
LLVGPTSRQDLPTSRQDLPTSRQDFPPPKVVKTVKFLEKFFILTPHLIFLSTIGHLAYGNLPPGKNGKFDWKVKGKTSKSQQKKHIKPGMHS